MIEKLLSFDMMALVAKSRNYRGDINEHVVW